jgi:hypothetical protein
MLRALRRPTTPIQPRDTGAREARDGLGGRASARKRRNVEMDPIEAILGVDVFFAQEAVIDYGTSSLFLKE